MILAFHKEDFSDEPTENYHYTLFPSALRGVSAFLISLFLIVDFPACNFTVLVQLTALIGVVFGHSRQLFFFSKKAL